MFKPLLEGESIFDTFDVTKMFQTEEPRHRTATTCEDMRTRYCQLTRIHLPRPTP